MNKIRVIDTVSTDQGAYRLLRTRVKSIDSDERFENYILCPSGKWRDKIVDYGVKCIELNCSRELEIKGIVDEIKILEEILLKYNPHIVHSHNSKTGALSRIAVKRVNKKYKKNIKIIHQVHGYHFTSLKGYKKRVFLYIEKFLANMSDSLLFQNKYEYELSKKYNMDNRAELIYIGNGINIEEFENINLVKETSENFKIVCVARIEPVKNHMMLVKTIKLLKEKYNHKNIKVILVGEGDATEIKKYLHENDLVDCFEFTGVLDRNEVIQTIYNSDISVLTSIKEGKPRALIESALLGKPCIGTNVVGTNEVILHNETGYLVNLNDYEDMAEKINDLILDKDKKLIFSENSRKNAYKEFNEKTVINNIKDIYIKILNDN